MKKIIAILLVLVIGFCFCSCSQKENSLLYFCGVKTLEDIEKIEFIYEEHCITKDKFNEWIKKYDKHIISQ